MSEKEPKEPQDPIQEQFQDFLRGFSPSSIYRNFRATAAPGGTASDDAPEEGPDDSDEALARIREFNLKPREVRDYLDRFVIKQDEAKKVLSVAICDHYNHVRACIEDPEQAEREYTKQNIILLGPTGVGKTYLMRCIAKLIGVPFVKADATKFSETGYVGHDVEDLVRDLNKLANGNLELAQYGIIYIDEIDKIASRGNGGGRDVSGRGVQINLLKLMEETEVSLHSQTDLIGQMESMMEMMHGGGDKARKRTLNTRHMLFIVSGAFDKLAERIKKRVEGSPIGFGRVPIEELDDADFLQQVSTRDFIDYGYEPEFIGRLPVRVICESLKTPDLESILRQSEGSILGQYERDFQGYGIKLHLADEAIHAVAERANGEGTGARGLMTVLERVLRNFKFELPSTSIDKLEIDAATVDDPVSALSRQLNLNASAQLDVLAAEVRQFAERFEKQHGLILDFTPDAVKALVDLSLETDKTIRAICEEKFRDFEYGLSLIARDTQRKSFTIDSKVVKNPGGELSRWVAESFRRQQDEPPSGK